MGILDDFKRLFWVNKAVAKSAAEKAGDKSREIGNDIAEKASDAWEKGKVVAEDLGQKVTTKAKETYHDAKEYASDLWDKKDDWTQKKEPEMKAEGADPIKTDENMKKPVEESDKTWDKAKDTGKEILDKAVKTSDKVWEKAGDVSEDMWNKAKEVAGNLHQKVNETMDSMLEKSKELDKKIEEEKDKVDANRDGWADKTLHDKLKEHDTTLKGKDKDDFFERASRYADGDYSMGKPIVSKPTQEDNPEDLHEGETPLPPLPKNDDFADDAILDDDPKNPENPKV
jgi:hypothetical protein